MKNRPDRRSPNCWLSTMLPPWLDQEPAHGVHDPRPVGAGQHQDEVAGRAVARRPGVMSVRLPQVVACSERSLRYATAAALVFAMSDLRHRSERSSGGRNRTGRAVGRPGAEHPRGAGPQRRGRGHRDRGRARRPQEHGVPAGGHPGGAPARRADQRTAASTASASASSGWPAPPPPGSTWSRRRARSAASSPPTPGRPSTSPCSPTAPRSTSTRWPAPRPSSRTTGSASTSRCTRRATARSC